MKSISIEGQIRTEFGKQVARQLRSEEKVPCVIYGGETTINFVADRAAFKSLVYTPEFQQAKISINGKNYSCVLKDLQFDRITDELIHVDFLELVADKKVSVNIPIKYVGTPAGVKAGGKLLIKMKSLKVKTLPQHLRENIEINIQSLELNKNIRVEDINIENLEILNAKRIPLASVVLTRQLKQEEKAAAKAAPAAAKAAPAAEAKKAEAKK